MGVRQILSGTLLSIVISIALHLLLRLIFPPVMRYESFYWTCLLLWALYCLVLLLAGRRSASSQDIHLFNRLVILSVALKIFLGLGMTVVYKLQWHPPDNYFIVPFLQVYLIFTVYETYALMQLGRSGIHK